MVPNVSFCIFHRLANLLVGQGDSSVLHHDSASLIGGIQLSVYVSFPMLSPYLATLLSRTWRTGAP